METTKLNEALDTLKYLIHILPTIIYYEPITQYKEAYNVIELFIKNYEEKNDDDLK